jgi:penicillin-binding protein 1C
MGNFSGETVIGKTGSSIPARIARDTLLFLQTGKSPAFKKPEHFHEQSICALSGMAPSIFCPSTISEYINDGRELPACTWHYREAEKTLVRYPAEYQAWFLSSKRQGEIDYSGNLEIVLPRDGGVYYMNAAHNADTASMTRREEIPVDITGGEDDELFVDYDGSVFTVERPFRFYLPPETGAHTLTVHCAAESASVSFTVK